MSTPQESRYARRYARRRQAGYEQVPVWMSQQTKARLRDYCAAHACTIEQAIERMAQESTNTHNEG